MIDVNELVQAGARSVGHEFDSEHVWQRTQLVIDRDESLVSSSQQVRSRSKSKAGRILIVVALALLLFGSVAVARDIQILSTSVWDALQLGDDSKEPSPQAQNAITLMDSLMEDDHEQSSVSESRRNFEDTVVLLDGEFDGMHVEVVANKRKHTMGKKQDVLCYTTVVTPVGDTPPSRLDPGGSIGCTDVMNPGLPINYAVSMVEDKNGLLEVRLSGTISRDVKSIDVVTENGEEPALVGTGAWWWRSESVIAQELIVTLRDGSIVRKEVMGYDRATNSYNN